MSFEDAVRRRLNLQGEYQISIEPSGGGEVQIGDYTWDSDPYEFALDVRPVITQTIKRKNPSLFHEGYGAWERGETAEPQQPTFTKHRIPRPGCSPRSHRTTPTTEPTRSRESND